MFDADDALDRWLFAHQHERRYFGKKVLPGLRRGLQDLDEALEANSRREGKPKYLPHIVGPHLGGVVAVPPEDLAFAQCLYMKLVQQGGAGNTAVQESLLDLVGGACDVSSLPFWQETLDINRPRDNFSRKRRPCLLGDQAS